MSSRRLERLNEQIKREISDILRTEVRDPRIGLPTVTEVAVTSDLWLARVYVRPDPTHLGTDEGEGFLEGLATAAPFIRRELGKSLKVRRVPELRFEADRTLERALRIERILHEVLPPDQEDRAGTEDRSGPEDEEGSDAEGRASGERDPSSS